MRLVGWGLLALHAAWVADGEFCVWKARCLITPVRPVQPSARSMQSGVCACFFFYLPLSVLQCIVECVCVCVADRVDKVLVKLSLVPRGVRYP